MYRRRRHMDSLAHWPCRGVVVRLLHRVCTQITRRAASRKGPSVEQLHDGGRSRREAWLEEQRLIAELKGLEEATFRCARV